jgi:hypothetical protein
MNKKIVICLFVLLVAGCAVNASKIYLPSGEEGYNITCYKVTWGHCYEKAGELCGARGYEVIVRSDDKGAAVFANQYFLYGGTTDQKSMLIKCK